MYAASVEALNRFRAGPFRHAMVVDDGSELRLDDECQTRQCGRVRGTRPLAMSAPPRKHQLNETKELESNPVRRSLQWELRRYERALFVDGVRTKVGGRAFDVLLALAERRGEVVSKADLIDAAWPGLSVEENNLSVQVSALRKVIGPEWITNVASQGYQLALPLDSSETSTAVPQYFVARPRLFGREAEYEALEAIVGVEPLVTVTGTGGVGKTSLARSILVEDSKRWRDGVFWIDLAPLRDGRELVQAVAKALGIAANEHDDPADELMQALSQRVCLIGLDNCEHLIVEVAALLVPILRRVGTVRWLTTSREPLHVTGERVYRLAPLDVPAPETPLDAANRFAVLRLFCERARAVDPTFGLRDDNVALAIALCRQLDGLPLAIEMAAARVATLGLDGLHEQIDQRLRLRSDTRDTPIRHSTLLQTYAWSYSLLSATEQRVFRMLEPFAGGFTPQIVQSLCRRTSAGSAPIPIYSWELLDTLSALVNKSLVHRDRAVVTNNTTRLHLLESARDYARHCLEENDEFDEMRRAHAWAVADWFAAAQEELAHWRDVDWTSKYLPERRNVCVALAWACNGNDPDLLASLVSALAQLDSVTRTDSEVVSYPIPMDLLERAALPLRAKAYLELGWAHFLDGSREAGTAISLRALADMEVLDDVEGIYVGLTRLVRLYIGRPGLESKARALATRITAMDESCVSLRARLTCHSTALSIIDGSRTVERLEQLHDIARHAGLDAQAAVCRLHMSDELLLRGRFDEVIAMTQPLQVSAGPLLRVRATLFYNRAHALVRVGRIEEAIHAAQEALRAAPGHAYFVLDLFAQVASDAGKAEDSARLSGRSARLKRERDLDDEASECGLVDEARENQERVLGAARRSALMREGAALAMADAITLAWAAGTSGRTDCL